MPRDDGARDGARDDNDDAQRAPKRAKIFRACTACVSSKTRCEDVTPAGCSLCRRRRKTCSLAAVVGSFENTREPPMSVATPTRSPAWHEVPHHQAHHPSAHPSAHPTPTHHPTPPPYPLPTPPPHQLMHIHAQASPRPNDVEDLRHRLAEAERRVERTESALAELQERVHQRPRADYVGTDTRINVAGPLRLATMYLYSLDETMFSVASTRSYPDPVGSLISAGQAELAWHGFKARISAVLPLPPFLAVSTPVPDHPFVLLAALHHVPGSLEISQRQAMQRMVRDSIALAMGGSAGVDVVLALLILSLAPPMPDDGAPEAPTNPSAYRLISLAYSIGQGFGLEARAEAALTRSEDLDYEPWAEGLWGLQLWCAVSNRYHLLALINSMSNAQSAPLALRLPVLSRDSVELCNAHLRAEAEVYEIYRPFVSRLAKMEHANAWPLVELEDLQHEWENARSHVRIFCSRTDKPPSVQNDAQCAEFALGVRIASLSTSIPSPLREARETTLQCLNRFPTTMKAMLDISDPSTSARRLDPSSLPEYVIVLLATALVCFRRSVQFVAAAYPQSQLVEPTRLDAAEATLRALGRAPRFILDESNRLLETLYASPLWPNHPVSNGTYAAPELNASAAQIWDMFDFGLLYPDLMMPS